MEAWFGHDYDDERLDLEDLKPESGHLGREPHFGWIKSGVLGCVRCSSFLIIISLKGSLDMIFLFFIMLILFDFEFMLN